METNFNSADSAREFINREESLGSWRSAILLGFNGFLLTSISGDKLDDSIELSLCFMGLFLSISALWVSYDSCHKKHCAWKRIFDLQAQDESGNPTHNLVRFSKVKYTLAQSFGPYILSALLLSLFWIFFIVSKLKPELLREIRFNQGQSMAWSIDTTIAVIALLVSAGALATTILEKKADSRRRAEENASAVRERAYALRTEAQQVIFECTNCFRDWREKHGLGKLPGKYPGQVDQIQKECREIYHEIESALERDDLDDLDLVGTRAEIDQKTALVNEIRKREFPTG